jgi:hypothetical protein
MENLTPTFPEEGLLSKDDMNTIIQILPILVKNNAVTIKQVAGSNPILPVVTLSFNTEDVIKAVMELENIKP